MTKKLLTAVCGLVTSAFLAVACQPMFAGPTGSRAVSRPGPVSSSVATRTTLVNPLMSTEPDTASPDREPSPPSSRGVIGRRYQGSGPKVVVLGDSLTVQSRTQLRSVLAKRSIKIFGINGEGLSGGAYSELRGHPVVPRIITEYASDPPAVVVMALGTNDVWRSDLTLAGFEAGLDRLADAFPRACQVGVTVTETSRGLLYDRDKAIAVNKEIRARADVVVDWAKLGPGPRYTLEVDHIHLTGEGARFRSDLIGRAVDRCLASQGPTVPPS